MGIARSTYYDAPAARIGDVELLNAITAICDEFEAYGWRRVQAALRHRGVIANHKRIKRLMREHDLQPRRRRRYIATTDSDHDQPIFPDRSKDIILDGPDQLWVADLNRWRDARCSGRPRKAASSSEHIASITGSSPISACPARITTAPGAAKVLDESDVAALFGLEMAETPHTPNPAFTVPKRPQHSKAQKGKISAGKTKPAAKTDVALHRATRASSGTKKTTRASARKRRTRRRP
ncbi:hypothetical protein Nham_4353 (plasmid) [Nitrobacter hamburgensis X14]|uniref:HTH-like domain-containing protein n=1 Tax=Nitrobacter hamburgensis (strain DSM 10229 / NCIMB 13809 / X14) TaxID=323097 RepID=Q1QFQ3_NITHX|nr:hypothetical protein Nham_4353 [Nitrobacter hamburgensis X14]